MRGGRGRYNRVRIVQGEVAVGDAAERGAGDAAVVRLIAADVGGTYARLGLVEVASDAERGPRIALRAHRRYACAGFPGLAAILQRFRQFSFV